MPYLLVGFGIFFTEKKCKYWLDMDFNKNHNPFAFVLFIGVPSTSSLFST